MLNHSPRAHRASSPAAHALLMYSRCRERHRDHPHRFLLCSIGDSRMRCSRCGSKAAEGVAVARPRPRGVPQIAEDFLARLSLRGPLGKGYPQLNEQWTEPSLLRRCSISATDASDGTPCRLSRYYLCGRSLRSPAYSLMVARRYLEALICKCARRGLAAGVPLPDARQPSASSGVRRMGPCRRTGTVARRAVHAGPTEVRPGRIRAP